MFGQEATALRLRVRSCLPGVGIALAAALPGLGVAAAGGPVVRSGDVVVRPVERGDVRATRAQAVRAAGVTVTRPRRVAGRTRNLGPNVLAGRVRAIVPRSDRAATLWVASATGGLWTSETAGDTWAPADDWLPTLTFSTLAADPQDADVMYAGSGEVFTFLPEGLTLRGQDPGDGILKTTDGGRTWAHLADTRTPDFRYVNRIAVHPTSPEVVLAATTTGLWRSPDGGDSWTQVRAGNFMDVRFHPRDADPATPGTQIDAVAGTASSSAFVALDNLGAAFDPVTLPAGLAGNQRIEVAPSPSEGGVWHAAHVSAAGLILLRSADRGRTFTAGAAPPVPVSCRAPDGTGVVLTNNRRYSGALWVSPTDPTRIVVGGVKLCRSTDAGATFTQLFPSSIHDDHHVVVESPGFTGDDSVYVGNDGGVYRIEGISGGAPTLRNLNDGLAIQQFHGASMNPLTGVLIGGTQDNGTLRRDTNGVWTALPGLSGTGSDGITAVSDPGDGRFWYFGKSRGRVRQSTDGGVTNRCFASVSAQPVVDRSVEGPCPPAAGAPDPANRCFNVTPFALDLVDTNVLYIGCANLWRTSGAKGAPENAVFAPIMPASGDHQVTAFAQAPSNPNVMWVGTLRTLADGSTTTDGHQIRRSGNVRAANPTFPVVEDGATLPPRPVADVAVRPSDANRVYVALSGTGAGGNVWRGVRAASGAVTWTDVASGLPAGPVWSLAAHPTVPGWVYAGTDAGLYVSHDDGTTWSAGSRGPANVPVSDLTWVDTTRLVVSTYGRGVFLFDETPNPELVLPERATVTTGVTAAGHVEDMLRSDDRAFRARPIRPRVAGPVVLQVSGRTGFPALRGAIVRGRRPGLVFTLEASASRPRALRSAPRLTIGLLNVRTRRFETVFQGPAPTGVPVRASLPGRAVDFIGPGRTLTARLTWTEVASVSVDFASWRITRPVPG